MRRCGKCGRPITSKYMWEYAKETWCQSCVEDSRIENGEGLECEICGEVEDYLFEYKGQLACKSCNDEFKRRNKDWEECL